MNRRLRCSCGNEVELAEATPPPAKCPACGRDLAAESEIRNPESEIATRCPFCREAVQAAARKCPHCQEYLDRTLTPPPPAAGAASPLAIVALVMALVSPFLFCFPGPLAAILGITALAQRKAARGRGMAIAAVVLGVVWTFALLLLVSVVLRVAAGVVGGPPAPKSPPEPLF